ncbi:MAG: hypothetical protein ABL949_04555 [Fimbriimonadaceae bacterium]
MITSVLLAHLALNTPLQARIVSVDRHEAFAGKLGHRVSFDLVVESDGVRYRVHTGRYHTNVAGKVPTFSIGDNASFPMCQLKKMP